MLIKLFESACLNEEGGEITGSIFGGNESRLKPIIFQGLCFLIFEYVSIQNLAPSNIFSPQIPS
jgi:hypothetical protein